MIILPCIIINLSASYVSTAQELEARSVDNTPVGVNAVAIGYGYSIGNLLLDPALPLENLKARLHGFVAAYARTFALLGKPARLDALLPYIPGDWEYDFAGIPGQRTINGFGDPRVRLTVLFSGAPVMTLREFQRGNDQRIVGASVQVFLPFGNYDPEELINLSSNRVTFRIQGGMKQPLGQWSLDVVGGIWIFTRNPKFLVDNELNQRPMVVAKTHLVRNFQKGAWAAVDLGYGFGGRTVVNETPREVRISALRFGLTGALPLSQQHSLKASLVSGFRFQRGPDFDAVTLGYQYLWGRK